MLKVGDIVTRKKYNNVILFRVEKIIDNKVILSGIDLRLYADADSSDLVLSTISKKKEKYEEVRNIDNENFFLIPGSIVHLDSDKNYLDKCLEYYKNQRIKCYGYKYNESEFSNNIEKILLKHNPSILVITGHDAYSKKRNNYKNSSYFIDTVKKARKISCDDLIIIAGACQSDFNNLIKSGATYASSPAHINIDALDPAIIASFIALTDKNEVIDLKEILSKTKYGSDGIGGIKTTGVMKIGYPRKDIN